METKRYGSMKNGTCPNCGSSEVYAGTNLARKGGSYNTIPISFMRLVALDNYVCVDCGYLERYISDRAGLERIKKKWPKVK